MSDRAPLPAHVASWARRLVRESSDFVPAYAGLTLAALAYGCAHNLVVALVCSEFYRDHLSTPAFVPDDVLALAVYWSAAGGFPGNVLFPPTIACIARSFAEPRLSVRDLVPAVRVAAVAASIVAVVVGIAAAKVASLDPRSVPGWVTASGDTTAAARFAFAEWETFAAQIAGYIAGVALVAFATVGRFRRRDRDRT